MTKLSVFIALILLPVSSAFAASILILGDSLSAGYGINENKGWVNLLQLAHSEHQIINGSVSGETSAGALRRLPALLQSVNPDLVVIEIGGNDGLRGFPLAKLKQNIDTIIDTVDNHGSQLLLTEIQVPPNYGPRYSKRFTGVFHQVAKEKNVKLIPFFMTDIAPKSELMQADGIHPNMEAQPMIMEWMQPWIINAIKP